ncbi:iron-sulfur cluster assembly scaffold protein [candidate division LCP-89 bacterium B3_LCP]|uniref:Iron-sulfur cluster assembly scaffold protein n=1 Tax=candidate division LCP-89 bacterium B3_LCP TaxID=2012998 RepID=A0A532UVT2_UNCL8|nr:MAG: iron-sulfur cluster assembly scaffold protein [candidate division LCP-89 bacterium B3_LCP]
MAIKYSQTVIEHFTNPQNVGEIEDADATATEGSPACGDMLTFTLRVNPETHIIDDVRFRSYGCASNISTASMATVLAKGKTIEEVKHFNAKIVAEKLGGLPSTKMHCSVLAVNGLKAAIKQWEISQGLAEEEAIQCNEDTIKKLLKSVINPHTGKSIISSEMVSYIKVDGAKVFVEVNLGDTDEMYAENIREEVTETIESMKCVDEIIVRILDREKFELKNGENNNGE